jgi:hypothetical protein
MVAIPSDDFDAWVRSQDQADDRAAAAAGQAASALPAEMTGAADLSQYGRWSSSTDYGTLWTPNDVPAGWAPYQQGSWSWIAPWGWTWIDAAPWGFAPFHYGRWVWINGHWAWVAGNWGARPVYAPGLVGWIGGPGFLLDGAPVVGWVPLGWDEPFFPPYWCSPVYWGLVNGPVPPPSPRRGVLPVRSRPLGVPSGQANYANRTAPGGVTIVPAAQMTQRPPVNNLRSPAIAHLAAEVAEGTAHKVAEPAPPPGREPAGLLGGSSAGHARDVGRGGTSPAGHAAPTPGGVEPGTHPAAPATPGGSGGPSGRGGGRSAAFAPASVSPSPVRPVARADAAPATAVTPARDRLRTLVPADAVASGPVRVSRARPLVPEDPSPTTPPSQAAEPRVASGFMPAAAGLAPPGMGVPAHALTGMTPRGSHQ